MWRRIGQAEHNGSCNEEIQMEQVPARAMKRGHDEAFSDSSAEVKEHNTIVIGQDWVRERVTMFIHMHSN